MNGPTFAQLLSEQMLRAGISDSELARAIGVQRQTIFRWKEGLVSRPRERDDVLKIAQKLRLSDVERDQLLLAAGFPPEQRSVTGETPPSALTQASNAPATSGDDSQVAEQPRHEPAMARPRWRSWPTGWWTGGLLLGALAILVAGGLAMWTWLVAPPLPTPTPTTPTATVAAKSYPSAQPGQRLILVAQFTGYTTQQFNVAGRIADELAKEIADSQLVSTTVAIWPAALEGQEDAQAALATSQAAAIIWGEYDSGRVRAALTLSEQSNTEHLDIALSSPDDLLTTINEQAPAEVRMFALLTIGALFQWNEFYTNAARSYQKALELNPPSQKTRALLNFYLAYSIAKTGTLAAYDEAIGYATAAIALNPQLTMALYNRGALWYKRSQLLTAGSPELVENLDAAIADFSATIAARPDYLPALINRGVAYYERNGPGDGLRAVQDFDQVIARQSRNPQGYFNRAFAHIRNGDATQWEADLQMTLALSPTYPAIHYALCWAYALAERSEQALPHCEQAVALDDSGASHDGRAIALAQSGQYAAAAADLRRYVAWARTLQPATRFERQHGPQAQQWIVLLERRVNPFTRATLAALR